MGKFAVLQPISKEMEKTLEAYSPLSRTLLASRGITTKEEAEAFFHPNWKRDVGDPFGILGMEKAVSRILKAIEKEEKILIYGDYDCDGIPGSVVLHDFFKKIEYKKFSNYIPHRFDEGYGFHKEAVLQAKKDGVKLIITVDVGITALEAVECANDLGIDVIITDHHLPILEKGEQKLPDAYVVLNSKQKKDTYHDQMLCGAGVAFKLVQALLKNGHDEGKFESVPVGWEKWLLDMAGLSTVADMVPLQNENRALAYFGLEVLRVSRRKGLMALLQKIGVDQKNIVEDDIGFMIGPRINAASRIDHPLRAFELLSATDDAKAIELANYLDKINDKRKGLVASMVREAKKKLAERKIHEVIVLGNPNWLPGLVGLVANKITEDFGRPSFVWGRDGTGTLKGSCRGIENVSVVDLMRETPGGTFIQFGGHDGAGGFSVSHENIHTLEEKLSEVYRSLNSDQTKPDEQKEVSEDAELSLDEVNWKTYEDIARFAPFGVGNPKPQFLFKGISIFSAFRFGRGKEHLNLSFRNSEGAKISAISFFAKPSMLEIAQRGAKVDMMATFEKSLFRKTPELRLRIVSLFDRK